MTNTKGKAEEGDIVDTFMSERTRSVPIRYKKFVKAYLETGNATEAVIRAGYGVHTRGSAGAMGSKLLKNDNVLTILHSHEALAEGVITDIMLKGERESDQIAAAKLLLAYTRGNPVSRSENINVNVSLEDVLKAN